MKINVAIDLLLSLIARAQQVSLLLASARAEGRESLNEDEINILTAQNNLARNELQAAIDKAKEEGR